MVSLHAFVLAAALAGSGDVVLLDFGADWCVPCRSMEPTIQRARGAGYPVRRVNVDQSPDLARHFAVSPIPCFVMVKNGQEVERVVGATSYDRLVQMFRQAGYGAVGIGNRGDGRCGHTRAIPRSPVCHHHRSLTPLHPCPIDRHARRSMLQVTIVRRRWNQPTRQRPVPTGRGASAPADLAGTSQIHQVALQATVRLRVVDDTGQSHGTGTIIDLHGDEALVLTCGHIFRESQGQRGDLRRAICSRYARPGARPSAVVRIGKPRFRAGQHPSRCPCDSHSRCFHGHYHPPEANRYSVLAVTTAPNPTVRVSTISAVDRYHGPPNIEIHGHPVQGRSGGGLFTADGRIIGICNAADLQEDRGIFAALPTLHYALTSINQQRIYLDPQPAPYTAATTPRSDGFDGIAPNSDVSLVPLSTPNPSVRGASVVTSECDEVIVIVRSKDDPHGGGRVIVVKHPTRALLQQLAEEAQQRDMSNNINLAGRQGEDNARLPDIAARQPPIVRAQGY